MPDFAGHAWNMIGAGGGGRPSARSTRRSLASGDGAGPQGGQRQLHHDDQRRPRSAADSGPSRWVADQLDGAPADIEARVRQRGREGDDRRRLSWTWMRSGRRDRPDEVAEWTSGPTRSATTSPGGSGGRQGAGGRLDERSFAGAFSTDYPAGLHGRRRSIRSARAIYPKGTARSTIDPEGSGGPTDGHDQTGPSFSSSSGDFGNAHGRAVRRASRRWPGAGGAREVHRVRWAEGLRPRRRADPARTSCASRSTSSFPTRSSARS